MSNPKCYHMSASSIASFKACPTRFRLGYREGLRDTRDTEAQRVGTNWHAMHEVYRNVVKDCGCYEAAETAAHDHLNESYASIPPRSTEQEWDLERWILLTCFQAYLWYYQEDIIDYLYNEIAFKLPVSGIDPDDAKRVGKIDHLIRWHGSICVLERKSTTRSIDPSSDYWQKSQKDTQVSMYALAVRDLMEDGVLDLPDEANMPGNTLYDVWRRPQIKPKMLTQHDTKDFQENKRYFDQSFDFDELDGIIKVIDGQEVEVKIGKNGYAIRESNRMFAARLLHEITENPERYFQRKEIARTESEINAFRKELTNIYIAQRMYEEAACWFENENQCRATFACPYIPICYGPGADAVCDGKTTPDGFRRIFTDLTKEGQALKGELE